MSNKDKVMDKYWLEFIEHEEGDLSSWKHIETAFWFWFYNYKMKNSYSTKLEDYIS